MASMTMTASFLCSSQAWVNAGGREQMVKLKKRKLGLNVEASNGNGRRRRLMFAAAAVSICSVAYFPLHSICKSYFQRLRFMNNLESNVETLINCVKWNEKGLMVWNCAALNFIFLKKIIRRRRRRRMNVCCNYSLMDKKIFRKVYK